MKEMIRILSVHQHWLFAEGLSSVIQKEVDMECVGVANDGQTAVELAKKLVPGTVLMSIDLLVIDGMEVAKQIKLVSPATTILVVSDHRHDYYARSCMELGLEGYVSMDVSREELVNIIRVVSSRRHTVLNVEAAKALYGQEVEIYSKKTNHAELHDRELQVLELAAQGMSNKEIATKLHLSVRTVETHFVNIYRKTGANSRLEATMLALKKSWLKIDNVL